MTKRSVLAILAGILFIIVVTMAVDVVLHMVGVYPGLGQPLDDRLSIIATSYRIVIGIVGGWLTARLAPEKPMKHALILGVIGTVLGVGGVAATWNLGLGPRWYPIALAVLALPQCWAGGRIYETRVASK